MKITFERIALAVLLGVLLLQPRSQPVQRDVYLASFAGDHGAISMAPGETLSVSCATGFRLASGSGLYQLNLVCREGAQPTATRTSVPSPSAVPSQTEIPATAAPSATMPHPTASQQPATTPSMQAWHAPGAHDGLNAHEHGDAPPAWANDWSIANFGHPVLYGGDERSSDIENTDKHQAFKGVAYRVNGNSSCPIDLYFRYHAASNPMDRASAFHSFELYMKDCQGGISFRQGVYWVGYPEFRSQRMTRLNEQAGTTLSDGSNLPAPGRDQFIIGAPDRADFARGSKCEQWYAFAGKHGGEYSITICQATTYFEYDEHLGAFHDMDTWDLTGGLGLGRRFEVTLYGPTNPRVPTAQPAGWFCASAPIQDRVEGRTHRPKWTLVTGLSSPSCAAGFIPQYTAPTFPSTGISADFGNTLPLKQFPSGGVVTVPN